MRPKATVRRTDTGMWRCTRPIVGFSPYDAEAADFDLWRDAIAHATRRIVGGDGRVEQAFEGSDGIVPAPRWTPFWVPD